MNGGTWPTYRTVILDQSVQEFVDEQVQVANRFEDQWNGIEWLLARSPHIGLPRDRNNPTTNVLYVVAANETAGTNEVWLLYSYTDSEVAIQGIKFAD